MNTYRRWLLLTGIALFFITLLLWPLRYPALYVHEDPDLSGSLVVTRDKPLENVRVVASRNLAGVAFYTVEEPKVEKDTFVELFIINTSTGENILSRAERFEDVFKKQEKKLLFTFPSHKSSSDGAYSISLRMMDASLDESLVVRGTLRDVSDRTSAQAVIQPLEKRSLLSILHSQLYGASTDGEDIYYYWARGGEVAHGNNPYVCALDDTCINHKNPGHFPFFYWLSAFSQQMGLHEFEDWMAFWRIVFILCYLGTGVVLFWTLYKRKQYELAIFALFFYLFNRWSLYVIRVGHVDFLALFFLTASLVLFEKRTYWSMLLFGISLATKQIAIFLAPLYLVLVWVRTEKEKRWKTVLLSAACMALVPLLTLVPFLVDNPEAVMKGLLFSATRSSEANMGAAPLVSILKLHGGMRVAPMALLMVLIYAAAYRRRMTLAMGGLAIMLVFIAFNTVTFNQYFLWFVPFLPLAAADVLTVYLKRTKS